jgi:hypothetical protein
VEDSGVGCMWKPYDTWYTVAVHFMTLYMYCRMHVL